MTTPPVRIDAPPADEPPALAEGFAHHLSAWARARGVAPDDAEALAAVGRAISRATSDGAVCMWLDEVPGEASLGARLRATGLVGSPNAPGAAPLVLDDDGRLYLHRYFDLERRLARRLRAAADAPPSPIEAAAIALLRPRAAPPDSGDSGVDAQALAAALALRHRLLIVSGGPGTGKTSTVVRLIAALLAQCPEARIALAAPTGKAAARMAQAIADRAEAAPAALRDRLPTRASTVHRLLGVRGDGRFVHDRQRPLPVDLLVVDEASMLDLALATRLLEAVPLGARIVLLGDRDQLAAVEAGAVFGELAQGAAPDAETAHALASALDVSASAVSEALAAAPGSPPAASVLPGRVIAFRRSHRFAAGSSIGRLAAALRDGDADAVSTLLRHRRDADDGVRWIDDAAPEPGAALMAAVRAGHADFLAQVARDPRDVAAALRCFGRFAVLCAVQQGPRGVAAINRQLEAAARRRARGASATGDGASRATAAAVDVIDPADVWYVGRPVMVLRNQPALQLFNGDVGVTLPDADGALKVWFDRPGAAPLPVPPWRLPPHQTAFATTVHKAQGSEFDRVLVLLPAGPHRVATRELLYTAVTRARQHVTLAAGAAAIEAAARSPTRRDGGLAARMAEAALCVPRTAFD